MNLSRTLLVTLAVVVLPACGDSDHGPAAPTVLYDEDFSVGTGVWGFIGTGPNGHDAAVGNPAGSMLITGPGSISAGLGPQLDNPFTMTLELKRNNLACNSAIYLTHTGNNTIYTAVNISNGNLGYVSSPAGGANNQNVAITSDLLFHEYKLEMTADGTITWWYDGVQGQTLAGFPDATYQVSVIEGAQSINVDNVLFTR